LTSIKGIIQRKAEDCQIAPFVNEGVHKIALALSVRGGAPAEWDRRSFWDLL